MFKPAYVLKNIQEVSNGELIRLSTRGKLQWALVVGEEDSNRHFLVVLSPDDEWHGPIMFPIRFEAVVLSYGKNYEFELSQEEEFLDLGANRFFRIPGVITDNDGRMLLSATFVGNPIHDTIYVDLREGKISDGAKNNKVCLFGKWSLRVKDEQGGVINVPPPVLQFEVDPNIR